MRRIAAAITAAITVFLGLIATPAHAVDRRANCVSGPEWSRLQTVYDSGTHTARRSRLEKDWRVRPVGTRNEFFQMSNRRYYTIAYHFCDGDGVMIVMVYRITSGGWQYGIKGHFIPTPSEPSETAP